MRKRGARHHGVTGLVTGAAAALVVACSVGFILLRSATFAAAVGSQIDRLAPRTITVMVVGNNTVGSDQLPVLPPAATGAIARLPGVREVVPVHVAPGVAVSRRGREVDVSVVETAPGYAPLTATEMAWGTFVSPVRPSAVLDPSAARALSVTGSGPGTVTVAGEGLPVGGVTASGSGGGPQTPVIFVDHLFAPAPAPLRAILAEADRLRSIHEVRVAIRATVARMLVLDGWPGRVVTTDAATAVTASRSVTAAVGSFAQAASISVGVLGALLAGVGAWRARRRLAVQMGFGASTSRLLAALTGRTVCGAVAGSVVGAVGASVLTAVSIGLPPWTMALADTAVAGSVAVVGTTIAAATGAACAIARGGSLEMLAG